MKWGWHMQGSEDDSWSQLLASQQFSVYLKAAMILHKSDQKKKDSVAFAMSSSFSLTTASPLHYLVLLILCRERERKNKSSKISIESDTLFWNNKHLKKRSSIVRCPEIAKSAKVGCTNVSSFVIAHIKAEQKGVIYAHCIIYADCNGKRLWTPHSHCKWNYSWTEGLSVTLTIP